MSVKHSMLPIVALLSIFISDVAFAQAQQLAVPEAASEEKIEKISVTGSFIKKIDVEGISPLESISSEEFAKRGATKIGDVFKQTPQFESVSSNGGYIRFRGQHAGNVLILLNGLRLPKLDGGFYTSIQSLPTSAIKQVEMLKDSGSAVYGSDAMSGVINFKTKDNFDGGEIKTALSRSEMTSQGMQQNISATYGKNFARGNIMGVFQYRNTGHLDEKTLGSYNTSPTKYGPGKTSNIDFGNNGSWDVGTTCASGSGTCQSDALNYSQSRSDNHDLSALLTGKYEFNNFDVSFLGLFDENQTTSLGSPQRVKWLDGNNKSLQLSSFNTGSSYYSQVTGIATGSTVQVNGSFVDELGDYITKQVRDTYSFQGKAEGYFGTSDWSWTLQSSLSLATYKGTVISGEGNQNVMKTMFENGTFNMFAPQGSKSNISAAKLKPIYRNNSLLFQTRAIVSGDVFDLGNLYSGGGMISMAAGAEVQSEDFKFKNDASLSNGQSLVQTSANFSGNRTIESAFAEFSASPHETVELSLAGRYDHYSDMGSTFNPKMGLSYRPFHWVLFRSSIGHGFRAPGITDVYSRETTQLSYLYDNVQSASGYHSVTSYNLSNLKPETAYTYNFGTVIQPYKNLTFSLDQWNYVGKNVITSISASKYNYLESQYGANTLAGVGVDIQRDGSNNITSMKVPHVVNIGKRVLRGLDAQLDYKFNAFSNFDMKVGSSLLYIYKRYDQRYSFESTLHYQKTWKNRTYVSLFNHTHYARLAAVAVSRDRQNQFNSRETELPSYYELNFNYSHTWKWGGKLTLTVNNLLNDRPQPNRKYNPVSYGHLSQAQSSFSPLRRRYYAGFSYRF